MNTQEKIQQLKAQEEDLKRLKAEYSDKNFSKPKSVPQEKIDQMLQNIEGLLIAVPIKRRHLEKELKA